MRFIKIKLYICCFILFGLLNSCDTRSTDNTILNFIRENNFLQNGKCEKLAKEKTKIILENLSGITQEKVIYDQLDLIYSNITMLNELIDKCNLTKYYKVLSAMLYQHYNLKNMLISDILQDVERYNVNIHNTGVFEMNEILAMFMVVFDNTSKILQKLSYKDDELEHLNKKLKEFNIRVGNVLDKKIDKIINDFYNQTACINECIKLIQVILNDIQKIKDKIYYTVYMKKLENELYNILQEKLNKV